MKKKYNKFKLIKRGFLKKCPICGNSNIYSKYLKIRKNCQECGFKLSEFKSDDGPAYFTIFIVGHIIIPSILLIEKKFSPSISFQMVFWPLLTLLLSLWLLPKVKGAFIALQIFLNDKES